MKITKIHLQNVGVFEDTTIEFPSHYEGENGTDIHIFTGENGSGKSTLLLALISVFYPILNADNAKYNLVKTDATLYFLLKRFRNNKNPELKSSIGVSFNYPNYPNKPITLTFGDYINKNDLFVPLGLQVGQKLFSYEFNDINKIFSYAVFIYTGHRAIIDNNDDGKKNNNEHPLKEAINLIKQTTAEQFFKFVKEQIVKSLWAERKGDTERVKSVNSALNAVKEFIKEVTNLSVEFELDADDTEKVLLLVAGQVVDYDALPDGLRSLMSWIADLLWRLDRTKWENNTPLLERRILLFLDEIEVHLHPSWQRKVLPAVKKLFKNAQVFISTHSPFVVNSIDGAFIHRIELEGKNAKVLPAVKSNDGNSVQNVLKEIFGVSEKFGLEASNDLDKFYQMKTTLEETKNEAEILVQQQELFELAEKLGKDSRELKQLLDFELRQLIHNLKIKI